jgi:sec-independent protein translocase protein TatA
MLSVGWQEMVLIFVVALVLFGPKKLPELGRTLGKAITEFRRASSELRSTFEREMQSLERENESLKEVTSSYANDINNSYHGYDSYDSNYDSPYDYGAYGSESYDSTATNPTTVGESATQDAEKSIEQAAPAPGVPGTVPRTPGNELASVGANGHAPEAEAEPSRHGVPQHDPGSAGHNS